ncbi:MAG TPA: dolichyl-phosphate beta-glucosyltransferase [Chthoniobacteraceae bacterium]|nr:dolichyl-phosphate beta-glucosyltransferase [Chthoniobacteraceae bacterium]
MSIPQLSIVVPAYNEERRLPDTLKALTGALEKWPFSCEVLIVVEKSRDATLEIARRAAGGDARFRVIAPGIQRGKGHAVRLGMLEARGEIDLFMDADLSVPLDEVPRLLAVFEQHPGAGVVIGSRKHAGSEILKRQSWMRQRMGESFNWLLRVMADISFRDTQCGFKAFRREAAQAVFSRQTIDGFAFDVELLLLADRLGFEVIEVPVRWINSGDSRVRIVRDSLTMLRDAIKVRRMVDRRLPAGLSRA